jgi:hypothetical protein
VAGPASAGFVAGLEERTVRAEADAYDATATDSDFEESLAPDSSPWLGAASAGVLVPTLGGTSSAVQDSALASGGIAAALSAEAAAQAYTDVPPAFGTVASEAYASWIFQVDASGSHRLSGRISASTIAQGDAFASLMLEELVTGSPAIPLVDLEANLDEAVDLDLAVDLAAGSVYRLTLLALAVVQMDVLTPPSRGLATMELAMTAVPEPTILGLWAGAALAIWAKGATRAASRSRRPTRRRRDLAQHQEEPS